MFGKLSLIAGLLALPLMLAGDEPAAQKQFDSLKALAGKWTTDQGGKAVVASEFRVTSAGSVVQETLFPGSDHEMVNMYSVDGDKLLMTHYCAMGNQPRLKMVKNENGKMKFEFQDATNLASKDAAHMDSLELSIDTPDQITEKWQSMTEGKAGECAVFVMKRQK